VYGICIRILQRLPVLHSLQVKYLFTNLARRVIANEKGCNEYTDGVGPERVADHAERYFTNGKLAYTNHDS
jgi:hypothetical protein